MKEKICIWGTGKVAQKIYYLAKQKFDIECFYDNDKKKHQQKLYGIDIQGWELGSHKNKIIIASSYWKEIAGQLVEEGMKPFVDFTFPSEVFSEYEILDYSILYELRQLGCKISYDKLYANKKIGLVYGNCQTDLISRVLRMHKEFSNDYKMITIPKVCEYNEDSRCLEDFISNKEFLQRVDLFIYQKVHKENRFSPILDTDFLVEKLSSTCKRVRIVNIYFSGYFPQYDVPHVRMGEEIHQSGIFPFGDKFIDDMIANGENKDSIIEQIIQEDFIDYTKIRENAMDSIVELKNREQDSDVCITDYIIQHYKEKQLFYSLNHPIEELLIEYTNRILKYIGFDELKLSVNDFCMLVGSLKGQDIPLYPSVIKALELDEYEKSYCPNRCIYKDLSLDFIDYIKMYIDYQGGIENV